MEPKGIVEFTSYGVGQWVDRPYKSLEDQLQNILLNVLLARDRAEQDAISAAEREKERARRAEVLEVRRKRKAHDQASFSAFSTMANAWETKAKLQSFYFALRSMPADGAATVGDRSIDEWKEWIERQIADSDPLKDGAEEVFRRMERERWRAD